MERRESSHEWWLDEATEIRVRGRGGSEGARKRGGGGGRGGQSGDKTEIG